MHNPAIEKCNKYLAKNPNLCNGILIDKKKTNIKSIDFIDNVNHIYYVAKHITVRGGGQDNQYNDLVGFIDEFEAIKDNIFKLCLVISGKYFDDKYFALLKLIVNKNNIHIINLNYCNYLDDLPLPIPNVDAEKDDIKNILTQDSISTLAKYYCPNITYDMMMTSINAVLLYLPADNYMEYMLKSSDLLAGVLVMPITFLKNPTRFEFYKKYHIVKMNIYKKHDVIAFSFVKIKRDITNIDAASLIYYYPELKNINIVIHDLLI